MKNNVIGFNLLRGLAAMAVFIAHLRVENFMEFGFLKPESQTLFVKIFFAFSRLGIDAVIAFFVLSGFLVLGKVIERIRIKTFDIGSYIIERMTRIFIPLIPTIILAAFILNGSTNLLQIIGNSLGLNGVIVETLANDGSLWTIAYEIWFYIMAGAVGCLFVGRFHISCIIILLISALVFTILKPYYLLIWVMGGLVILYRDEKRQILFCILGTLLIIAGTLLWQIGSGSFTFKPIDGISLPMAELLIAQGVCMLIPTLGNNTVTMALNRFSGPINYMSGISYSLYLVHYPVFLALDAVFPRSDVFDTHSILGFWIKGIAAFLASNIMWLLFERNTAKIRRFIRNKPPKS